MAGFNKKILKTFCEDFKKVKDGSGLTIYGTRMDKAIDSLSKETKNNKKLYNEEMDRMTPLWNALGLRVPDDDCAGQIKKAKNVKICLDKLANSAGFWSFFTRNYWKDMSSHCDNLLKYLNKLQDEQERQNRKKKEKEGLNAIRDKYGKFTRHSKSCLRAKNLETKPEFYFPMGRGKTWVQLFKTLPEDVRGKYKDSGKDENDEDAIREFIVNEYRLPRNVEAEYNKKQDLVYKAFRNLIKEPTEDNYKEFIRLYIELKKMCRKYKNTPYIHNILLWRTQDLEFNTFRKYDLAIPKEEINQ